MSGGSRRTQRGFTLVEVIVVLVILSILAAILIPAMTGWIDEAKDKICQSNRAQIERYYLYEKTLYYIEDEEVTLEKVLGGAYAESSGDVAALHCPSGGTYSASGEHILCSVHSGFSDESFGAAVGVAIEAGNVPNVSTIASTVDSPQGELAWLTSKMSDDLKAWLAGKTWTVVKGENGFSDYRVLIYNGSLSGYSGTVVNGVETIQVSVYDSNTGKITQNQTAYVKTKSGKNPAGEDVAGVKYIDIKPY